MMASIILIMILSLFGNTIPEQTQVYILYGSTILMYGAFIVTGVEAMLVWRKIKAAFTQGYSPPTRSRAAPATTTFSRMIMPRRWRSPRPQVARGEFPK